MKDGAAYYPTRAKIMRLIDAAKEAGLKVGGMELTRDGTIRILSDQGLPPANVYDDWQRSRGR